MSNSHTLHHSSFDTTVSNSPPNSSRRGVASSSVPSYAYGAPTLANQSSKSPTKHSPQRNPSPTRSSASSTRRRVTSTNQTVESEAEHDDLESSLSYSSSAAAGLEPGSVRYARLKQRNQALGNTSRSSAPHPAAPGIILSPPNGQNLRDTSVNVASAFFQAVSHDMPSTSDDYRKETHVSAKPPSTSGRRIAPPPSKVRKPNSAASSRRREHSQDEVLEAADGNRRAKSPVLEVLASVGHALGRAATSPTRYFLRENDAGDTEEQSGYQALRLPDPSMEKPPSQHNKSNDSYDYQAEENFVRGETSTSSAKSKANHHKRKSLASLAKDNQAYRPPASDDDDDDFEEDDTGGRRRKKKHEDGGRALTNLPKMSYDKHRKKKKSFSKKEGGLLEEEGQSTGDEHLSTNARQISRPPSMARSRAGSVPLDSVPPSHPAHYQTPIPEVDETPDISLDDISQDVKVEPSVRPKATDDDIRRMESQRSSTPRKGSSYSPGRTLGTMVYTLRKAVMTVLRLILQVVCMVLLLVATAMRGIYTALIGLPLSWVTSSTRHVRGGLPWIALLKVFTIAFVVAFAAIALRPSGQPSIGLSLDSILQRIKFGAPHTAYTSPTIPPDSLSELIDRLGKIESALAELATREQQLEKAQTVEQRSRTELSSRVEVFHGRLESESQRALEAEENFRLAASKGLTSLRSEFEALQANVEQTHKADETDFKHELHMVAERLSSMEVGLKEASDKIKGVGNSGSQTGFWNTWSGNGDSKLTIKSTDGQDITSLIGSLVDHGLSRYSKDVIAKPDFALYFPGGRVIPSLTSSTYEVRPKTWAKSLVGSVTGWGHAIGRPPVTALHPDLSVGNCWPFAGSEGQIGVFLARSVFISEFTIDHASRDVAYDIRSAPRQMEVWALAEGTDNISKVKAYQQGVRERRLEEQARAKEEGLTPPSDEDSYPKSLPRSPNYIQLAQFTYDVRSPQHIQTFSVPREIQDIGVDFGVVVLIIKNNWGDEDYTCLYRFRVHGIERDRRPFILPEHESS